MDAKAQPYNIGRWQRPRVYGTIVALYFLILGSIAIIYLGVDFAAGKITKIEADSPLFWGILLFSSLYVGFLVLSILAGVITLMEIEGKYVWIFQYEMLIVWFLTGGLILPLVGISDSNLNAMAISILLSMYTANILMYIFLYKSQSGSAE